MFKKSIISFILLFSILLSGFSQTTIGIQDFEIVPTTPTMTFTGGAAATGNGAFPNAPKFVSGSRGRQVNNSTTNITYASVDASAFSSVFFTCRLASFAGTSGNGSDGADFVTISVSTDGGTSWSQELRVNGNNNAKWSFTSGTGTASTIYDGDNIITGFAPAGGGNRTTDGFSTITVTGLPAVTTLRVRLEFKNNSGNEIWVVDDAEIKGTIAIPCVAPVGQASGLTLFNVTDASIDGSFTGTAADGYIVIRSTSSTLSGTPIDGTTYNPGDALGGGIVVSSSTATTFTASGLNPTTVYYFFVFAYNNLCSGGPTYNITNPAIDDETTLALPPFTTKVVVSEYFNASEPRDEWLELIVVVDNTDMRNWTIRDNNSSTSSFQPAITFRNISFWNNMRGGTIIKIWHRSISSGGIAVTVDSSKDDGYVEFGANDAAFFSGGNFGTSPTFAGSSLNVATSGDFIELRDASASHVHALGHDGSPGASVGATANPKVLRNNNFTGSGESVRVIGNLTANYDGGITTSNSIITTGGAGITSGLANDANNQILWRRWREPDFTTQAVVGNVCGATCVNFTWNKMTDPVPTDDTQGYLILRKPTAGTFTAPTDGTSYVAGATLGGATVVVNLDNPTAGTTIMYIDNAATAGTAEYRIYGYRYTDDNVNGNSFDLARGRAYNITDFVTVTLAVPLPITLLNFDGEKQNNKTNLLKWATSSEINNDFFTLEKSANAINFNEIGTVSGAGNSNTQISYQFIDDAPFNGMNYYRLKQTDFDGGFEYFNTIALNNNIANTNIFTANNTLQINLNNEIEDGNIEIYDAVGRIVYSDNITTNKTINTANFNAGIYIIKITTPTSNIIQKVKF
ncbi:MAG: T9SS type A sorting domain-containing protein [Flavobacteriales bacterium]|nr:T9SS type A sorting domain-containing protein [Flavobacteriales bacterium]